MTGEIRRLDEKILRDLEWKGIEASSALSTFSTFGVVTLTPEEESLVEVIGKVGFLDTLTDDNIIALTKMRTLADRVAKEVLGNGSVPFQRREQVGMLEDFVELVDKITGQSSGRAAGS